MGFKNPSLWQRLISFLLVLKYIWNFSFTNLMENYLHFAGFNLISILSILDFISFWIFWCFLRFVVIRQKSSAFLLVYQIRSVIEKHCFIEGFWKSFIYYIRSISTCTHGSCWPRFPFITSPSLRSHIKQTEMKTDISCVSPPPPFGLNFTRYIHNFFFTPFPNPFPFHLFLIYIYI